MEGMRWSPQNLSHSLPTSKLNFIRSSLSFEMISAERRERPTEDGNLFSNFASNRITPEIFSSSFSPRSHCFQRLSFGTLVAVSPELVFIFYFLLLFRFHIMSYKRPLSVLLICSPFSFLFPSSYTPPTPPQAAFCQCFAFGAFPSSQDGKSRRSIPFIRRLLWEKH